jgi:FkbM family methyltransferase
MLLFDIGANHGRYALAHKDRFRQIVSVEASPSTYTILCRAVAVYQQIKPLHFAVTNISAESVTFYHCAIADTISTLDRDWLSSEASRFGNYRNTICEVQVPTTSLDKLIAQYGIPDLLKVDVEGAENIVLASLTQKVPVLCFEWAAEWRSKNKQCIAHLTALGFSRFHIQMEDKYDYLPPAYDRTAEEVLAFFDTARDKVDWGMVWAS